MTDALSVCIVTGSLGCGGAERQLVFLSKALQSRGVRVEVLTLSAEDHFEGDLSALGIRPRRLGGHPSRAIRLVRVAREVRRMRPAVVQSQHFYTNLYAYAAARAAGIPSIGALRGDALEEVREVGGILGRWSLNLPSYLAANSQAAIENAIASGIARERIWLLPNVVDAAAFSTSPRGQGARIVVLAVGRLESVKRMDRFLRVMKGLRSRLGTGVHGVIVGSGREESAIRSLITHLELEGAVDMLSPRSDIGSLYAQADMLLMTSDWEGTPNVVLEAMSSGLPVVSTAVGGVPALVRHGEAGFIAPASDEEQLLSHALALCQDAALRARMGAQGRAFVTAEHGLDRLASAAESMYAAVLDRTGERRAAGALEARAQ